jgi:formate dehydrogenase major subunit
MRSQRRRPWEKVEHVSSQPSRSGNAIRAGEEVTLTIDGAPSRWRPGVRSCVPPALAGADTPSSVRRTHSRLSARAACVWWRSKAARAFPASCTTEVAAGMKVRTVSDALTKLRRSVLELYVSEHPMGSCPDSSRCELESLATRAWQSAIRGIRPT